MVPASGPKFKTAETLSSEQSFNMRTRSVEPMNNIPLTLTVTSATRARTNLGVVIVGTGFLQSRNSSVSTPEIQI